MELFASAYHAVDRLSTGQAAAAGGIGSGLSIATVMSVDPTAWAPWLQIATLTVGLVTGLASLALVLMKLVQQRRAMRSGQTITPMNVIRSWPATGHCLPAQEASSRNTARISSSLPTTFRKGDHP